MNYPFTHCPICNVKLLKCRINDGYFYCPDSIKWKFHYYQSNDYFKVTIDDCHLESYFLAEKSYIYVQGKGGPINIPFVQDPKSVKDKIELIKFYI